MATLTVQTITTAGVVPAALVAASASGDQFSNNGRVFLTVTNGAGAPITVTIASQRACDQGSTHNVTNTVANGATERMGPFDPARFNDGTGMVQITYSSHTSVTVGVASI